MFGKKKTIVRQDERQTCRELICNIQKQSDDLQEQLELIKECDAASQDKMLAMLSLIQKEYATFSLRPGENMVEIPACTMEYFLRALLDMGRHMQSDLPEGVYDYILRNSEAFYNIVAGKCS